MSAEHVPRGGQAFRGAASRVVCRRLQEIEFGADCLKGVEHFEVSCAARGAA